MIMALAGSGNTPSGAGGAILPQGQLPPAPSSITSTPISPHAAGTVVVGNHRRTGSGERRYSVGPGIVGGGGDSSAVARALTAPGQLSHSVPRIDLIGVNVGDGVLQGSGRRESPVSAGGTINMGNNMTFGLSGTTTRGTDAGDERRLSLNNRELKNVEMGGGESGEDDSDDFVFVEQAVSHPWRAMEGSGANNTITGSNAKGNLARDSAGGIGARVRGTATDSNTAAVWGTDSNNNSTPHRPNTSGILQSSSGLQESDAMQISPLAHRCSMVVGMVTAITYAGDDMCRKAMQQVAKKTNETNTKSSEFIRCREG